MVCLLAFDTATEVTAVSLQTDAGHWAWNGPGGAQASAELLPQVRRLLRQAGIGIAQLQAIGFGQGPGAFTGLRTACAVAQGLAFGAERPVLPLDSLMLVAEDARLAHPKLPDEVEVAMDARMDEVYAARYRWLGGRWQVQREPALYTLPALRAAWQAAPPRAVAGSALAAFGDRLPSGDVLRIAAETDRAAALRSLALQQWQADAAVDAAEALPRYLRDKVALTTAEREAVAR